MKKTIRVLIVDDSALVRGLLRALLEVEPDIEVVGEATNGRQAVEMVRLLKPGLVTMDLDMPGMNGIAAIEEIMCTKAVPILVVSSAADAQNALAAVASGALEVIAKPEYGTAEAAALVARVRLLSGVSVITRLRPRIGATDPDAPPPPSAPMPVPAVFSTPPSASFPMEDGGFSHVFAIATSTGGPQALAQILPALPAGFSCPVLVAQHISDGFAQGMVDWLNTLCPLSVRLAQEGEALHPGHIYISPSERHLAVTAHRTLTLRARNDHDLYRPSCDVLLESMAAAFGARAVGIILTGMGHDGIAGLEAIRSEGGATLAQDEASSVIFGMNRLAIERGLAGRVLPLAAISAAMIAIATTKPARGVLP